MGLNIAYASSLVSAYPIVGVDIHKNKFELEKNLALLIILMQNPLILKKKLKKF